MDYKAVIFDLDGVIVSTDELHYQGWKQVADQEGIPFDRQDNNRLRGVSRMQSLEIILEKATRSYNEDEKVELATRKNDVYRELLKQLTPADILPGIPETLAGLKAAGVKLAIGSSSKNAPTILERIGLLDTFEAIADGNQISKSKPDPEVFQLAAKKLGVPAKDCLVVEDALAGAAAAIAGGMAVFCVGDARQAYDLLLGADRPANSETEWLVNLA